MQGSTGATALNESRNSIEEDPHVQADKTDSAVAMLEDAVRNEPSNKDQRRKLADAYFSVTRNYPDALKLYYDLLAADPFDHDALLKIGKICMALGKPSDAIHFLKKLTEIDPWNQEAWKHIELLIEKRIETCTGDSGAPENEDERSKNDAGRANARDAARASADARLISIIILTFNQLNFTQACIASILEHTPESHEIIFVDNGSTDGTVAWLKQLIAERPNYRFVENKQNLGFARGTNCGISIARGDYVLLLNNDTVVTPGWLKGLVDVAEQDDRIGMVGPRSNHVPGPQQVESIDYNPETLAGLDSFSQKLAERCRGKSMPHWRIVGFCMLIKKKVIETIGGFDPRFAIGNFEDDDFCLRAHLAGFSARIAENCFVHHFGAQTFKGNGLDHTTLMARNWQVFKEKWGLAPEADFRCGYTVGVGQIRFDPGAHYVPVKANQRSFEQAAVDESIHPAPKPIGDLYEEGLHRAGSGDIQTAVEKLSALVSAHPDHAAAWNDLGVLYYQIGDKQPALACYEQAVARRPDNVTFTKNLADFYFIEQHRLEDALRLYRNVIRVADRDMESLTAAGRICFALKWHAEAGHYYERVRTLDPGNEEASRQIRRLGQFQEIERLLRQKRYGEAMAAIERAIVDGGIDDGMLEAALAVREKIGPMEVRSAATGQMTVSLCMIVKDEERDLPVCLHHVKPFVDEMIVVDTGSKDRTKALAMVFGAHVFETLWEKDFSKARNLSISKAAGNWILIMDADEVLAAADLAKFNQITRQADGRPRAYSMQKRHYTLTSHMIGWRPNQGEYPAEEKGTGWCSSRLVRLFPNDARIRFSFPVHELVEPSLKKLNIETQDCEIPIHHYGKLRESRSQEKTKMYRVLGKKKLKQHKRDSAAIRELAIQCAHLGRHVEAITLWKDYLKKEPRAVEAFLNIGTACWSLGRYAEAVDFAEKALRIAPAMKEARFNRAVALLMMGRAAETKSILQSVLEKQPDYPAARFMLCVAHACLGEQPDVEGALSALKSLPMGDYLHLSFLDIAKKFVCAARCDYARSTLEAALRLGCGSPELTEFLENCRAAA